VPRLRRWLAPLFLLAALALIPWTVYLVVSLPGRHLQTGYYDVAWGGFDLALAVVLAATGCRAAAPRVVGAEHGYRGRDDALL
jgi:hypothetical protein